MKFTQSITDIIVRILFFWLPTTFFLLIDVPLFVLYITLIILLFPFGMYITFTRVGKTMDFTKNLKVWVETLMRYIAFLEG